MITYQRAMELLDKADESDINAIELVLDSDEYQVPRLYNSLCYHYGRFTMHNGREGGADLSELSEPPIPANVYDRMKRDYDNEIMHPQTWEMLSAYKGQLKNITDTDVERKKAEIKRRHEYAKEKGGLICRE